MFSINYEKIPKYNLANSYFSTIIDNAIATKQRRDIPMIARLTITEQTSLYTEILQVSRKAYLEEFALGPEQVL